jgi:copper transport protein
MTSRTSALRRVLACTLLVLVGVVAGSHTAGAHANLVSISPKDGQAFAAGAPPRQVVVRFDESVTAKSAISLFDGRGEEVGGVVQRDHSGTVVTARLPDLPDGLYAIVWHVVSDDGHPEHGVSTFSVGAAGIAGAKFGSLGSVQVAGHGYGVVFGILRFLAFAGAIVFTGGLAVARWMWPASIARRDVRVLLVTAAGVAIVAALLTIAFQAGYASGGGWSKITDSGALQDVLDARYGRGALARVVLLVALLPFAVLRIRTARAMARIPVEIVVGSCAVGVLATFAYSGHAASGRWTGVGIGADLVHLAGVAFWIGGIVLFGVTLVRVHDAPATLRAVDRFSRVALPAVGIVVLSGALQAWRQLRTWSALWDTDYGHLLLAKVLVVVSIVIVASATRDILRSRFDPGASTGVEAALDADTVAVAQLRAAILVEVLLAGVVLAITAALVVSAP